MSDQMRYKSAPFYAFPIDRAHALISSSAGEGLRPVVHFVPFILGLCLTPRTIVQLEHLVLTRSSNENRTAIRPMIDSLIKGGFLQPVPPVPPVTPSPALPAARPITSLGVITADRPAMLERCLGSYNTHIRTRAREVRILVLDGSQTQPSASANRAIANRFVNSGLDVRYIGTQELGGLRLALVASGFDARLMDFAVPDPLARGASSGGWRNALLLLTGGEHVLMVDDDTVCATWHGSATVPGVLEVAGHVDPRHYEFFETREDAIPSHGGGPDLLSAHEALLGRLLSDLADPSRDCCETRDACGHMWTMLFDKITLPRVRATLSGVAGDGGLTGPHLLLFKSGQVREVMTASQDLFETAMMFREMRRIVPSAIVTLDPLCELHCIGLDNSSPLPPFSPLGSGEAGAFGRMLALCDGNALTGHVPCGIVRDSARPAVYEGSWTADVARVTVSEIIAAALSNCGISTFLSSAQRMPYAGLHLQAVAALAPRECGEIVRLALLKAKCEDLFRLDKIDVGGSSLPAFWKGALARYRSAVLTHLERDDFFVPDDLLALWGEERTLPSLRSFLGSFGSLLQAWPEMCAAARNVESRTQNVQ